MKSTESSFILDIVKQFNALWPDYVLHGNQPYMKGVSVLKVVKKSERDVRLEYVRYYPKNYDLEVAMRTPGWHPDPAKSTVGHAPGGSKLFTEREEYGQCSALHFEQARRGLGMYTTMLAIEKSEREQRAAQVGAHSQEISRYNQSIAALEQLIKSHKLRYNI